MQDDCPFCDPPTCLTRSRFVIYCGRGPRWKAACVEGIGVVNGLNATRCYSMSLASAVRMLMFRRGCSRGHRPRRIRAAIASWQSAESADPSRCRFQEGLLRANLPVDLRGIPRSLRGNKGPLATVTGAEATVIRALRVPGIVHALMRACSI